MIYWGETSCLSDKNKRVENEDLCGWLLTGGAPDELAGAGKTGVFFVADGVSSTNGKETVRLVERYIRKEIARLAGAGYDFLEMDEQTRADEIFLQMKQMLRTVDSWLRPTGYYGATASVAFVLGDWVYTANLGDSPILLVRLTEYDEPKETLPAGLKTIEELYCCGNQAGRALAAGEMSEEEALQSDRKDYLTGRVLGDRPDESDIATGKAVLGSNNLLLLGTDGALSVLPKQKLLDIVAEHLEESVTKMNRALYAAVREEAWATDNYTLLAQVIRTG